MNPVTFANRKDLIRELLTSWTEREFLEEFAYADVLEWGWNGYHKFTDAELIKEYKTRLGETAVLLKAPRKPKRK